jgi:glycosyltransferase involved in cell wall biosynthesis
MPEQPRLFIAIPAMDEYETIGETLHCIQSQTYRNFMVYICVNQPEKYHYAPAYSGIVESNRKTIEMLSGETDFQIQVIDRSSPGHGWDEKGYGVGWARKVLFDDILDVAQDRDIVVSMDADTQFGPEYFASVAEQFLKFPHATALANPYYHPLSGNAELDRLMLRYEAYMRVYLINLFRIGSPYNFTALGSAISFPVSAYRRIRGLAPKFSGEDFYLLQKLRKTGKVLLFNPEVVKPATRYSDRVFFGTGPALIRGKAGDWSSYPVYSSLLFEKVRSLYNCFNLLFDHDIPTDADEFIRQSFNTEPYDLWAELRQYNKDKIRFVHACHVKFDGLRTLQFLRFHHFKATTVHDASDELFGFLNEFFSEEMRRAGIVAKPDFMNDSPENLNVLRDLLFEIELEFRMNDHDFHLLHPYKTHTEVWKYLGS